MANNQYRRWSWPIPSPGPHTSAGVQTLELQFTSVAPLGNGGYRLPWREHKAGDNSHCSGGQPQSLRQEYLSFGNDGVEDYAQMVPPLPQGPWGATYLVWSSANAPLITAVATQITPRGGMMPTAPLRDGANNSFVVNATVHLDTSGAGARGTLTLRGNWSSAATITKHVVLPGGAHAVSVALEATNVKLWWPNTYGEQARYKLTASFTSDDHDGVLISTSRLIGFRTVAFVNRMYTTAGKDAGFTGKPRLFYVVNGVPIFVRGANVVSLDVLESRVTTERYRNMVESAAAAHFSIFRVNGDANYMKVWRLTLAPNFAHFALPFPAMLH